MKKQTLLFMLLSLLLAMGNLSANASASYLLKIETSEKGFVSVFRMNGVEVKDQGSVTAGEKLQVVATVTDDKYKFSHFTIEKGSAVTLESEGKGVFTVSGTGKVLVSASFVGLPQTITCVEADKAKGSYTVTWNGKTVRNGDKVPYGSKITIKGLPKAGFSTKLISANDAELDLEDEKAVVSVLQDLSLAVAFDVRMLRVVYEQKAIGETSTSYGSLKVYVKETGEALKSGDKVAYGTELRFELLKVYKTYLLDLIVNDKPCAIEETDLSGSYITYDSYLVAKDDIVAAMKYARSKTSGVSIAITNQEETYDGKTKSFNQYSMLVDKLRPDYKVKYKKEGTTEFVEEQPVDVGSYRVQILREADAYFTESKKEGDYLKILPAPTSIRTLPQAVVRDGEVTLSGGAAYTLNSKTEGVFSIEPGQEIIESKVIKVNFVPSNVNFAPASCMIPVVVADKPLNSYPIRIGNLPSGVTLKVMNGDLEVRNGDKVFEGTVLSLIATCLDADKKIGSFVNQLGETSSEPVASTLVVNKEYKLSVLLQNNYQPQTEVVLKEDKIDQTGIYKATPCLYSASGLSNLSFSDDDYFILSYTDQKTGKSVVAPINVGVYDVAIYYPARNNIKEFRGKGTYTVTPKAPKLVNTDQLTASEVIQGQTLESSIIRGGDANVIGKFEWKEPKQKVAASKGYKVLFIPADQLNYDVVEVPVALTVPISDDVSKMAISIYAEHGDVMVRNKQLGTLVKSGEVVRVGDQLEINASPASGYKFKTLMVDGNTVSNGSIYTVAQEAPVILAEFEAIAENPDKPRTYTVTIPSVVGAIVSHVGETKVVEGSSFIFMIDYDLAYGAPKVTADGKALIHDGAYAYTIAEVTADVDVVITLPAYGFYTVKAADDLKLGAVEITPVSAGLNTEGYTYGSEVRLTAIPKNGTRFHSWWDGDTENPRTYKVKGHLIVNAKFTGTPTDIEHVDNAQEVWSVKNRIYVKLDSECLVVVTDMQGKNRVNRTFESSGSFTVNTPGVYVVALYHNGQLSLRKKLVIE